MKTCLVMQRLITLKLVDLCMDISMDYETPGLQRFNCRENGKIRRNSGSTGTGLAACRRQNPRIDLENLFYLEPCPTRSSTRHVGRGKRLSYRSLVREPWSD